MNVQYFGRASTKNMRVAPSRQRRSDARAVIARESSGSNRDKTLVSAGRRMLYSAAIWIVMPATALADRFASVP
jgi:hypothetical protein